MGRGSGREGSLTGQLDLLAGVAGGERVHAAGKSTLTQDPEDGLRSLYQPLSVPTEAKSRLIAEYLSLYQKVTKGGIYIDGFAAPQDRRHPEACTARRVLEIVPPRLRTFWLCELDPKAVRHLHSLKQTHHRRPRSRRVIVEHGDFNQRITGFLRGGYLTPSASVFALLDQRSTECHWASVRQLAGRSARPIPGSTVRRYKIELLYFLGSSWIHRSLRASKHPEKLREIANWWGKDDWSSLLGMSQANLVKRFADRFVSELGYGFVHRYPIYRTSTGVQKAYYLIHATDHPEGPKLMQRAFQKVIGDAAGSPVDSQGTLF
jgi:three-Cys-motif partner protein